jgi:hypothetical protein
VPHHGVAAVEIAQFAFEHIADACLDGAAKLVRHLRMHEQPVVGQCKAPHLGIVVTFRGRLLLGLAQRRQRGLGESILARRPATPGAGR